MIIGIVISAFVAGVVAIITFFGQLQLYRRIKEIIDHSLGHADSAQAQLLTSPKVIPDETDEEDGVEHEVKPTMYAKVLKRIRTMHAFGKFSEIAIILNQLDWLEGKVKIVTAFVPVVAKLVCRQGVSDAKVLDSKLSRRMGCYMFVDIAGSLVIIVY